MELSYSASLGWTLEQDGERDRWDGVLARDGRIEARGEDVYECWEVTLTSHQHARTPEVSWGADFSIGVKVPDPAPVSAFGEDDDLNVSVWGEVTGSSPEAVIRKLLAAERRCHDLAEEVAAR